LALFPLPRQCAIKITLNNEGPDGDQRHKYGDSIVVERKINRNERGSTSSYKVKSAGGKGKSQINFCEFSYVSFFF
jgi:hypothetical protein